MRILATTIASEVSYIVASLARPCIDYAFLPKLAWDRAPLYRRPSHRLSYIQDWRRNPARLPYPPGPKGYPIIGNLLDILNAFIYKRFRKMSSELGTLLFAYLCFQTPTSLCL